VSFKSQFVLHTSPLNTHHNIKMLSSISSYIWGPSEEPIGKLADEMDDDERSSLNSSPPLMLPPAATPEDLNSPTATTEDWVLVGQQPQPGNLATGGIGPPRPPFHLRLRSLVRTIFLAKLERKAIPRQAVTGYLPNPRRRLCRSAPAPASRA